MLRRPMQSRHIPCPIFHGTFENLNNDKTRTYKTFSNIDDHAFTRCTMLITAMSECATNSVKIDMDDEIRTEFM